MKSAKCLRRYEHNYFRGWVVATTRRGQKWIRYFSDRPDGRRAALARAKEFRDQLLAALPPPRKIKRRYVLNVTGVVGVARLKERTRAGRPFVRYVATLPPSPGRPGKASFSVSLYGESRARRLAIQARRQALAELGL